jgi:hypothetical protein
MSPEKQRIAIAGACGWTEIQPSEYAPFGKPYLVGRSPNKFVENLLNIPDFCNDLNAMYEAEKALTEGQRIDYVAKHLWEIVPAKYCFAHYFWATAAQRAEAFLRTIGKWGAGK